MKTDTTFELLLQGLQNERVQNALQSVVRSAMKDHIDAMNGDIKAMNGDIKATERRLAGLIGNRPTTSAIGFTFLVAAWCGWLAADYWKDCGRPDSNAQSLTTQLDHMDSSLQRIETSQGSILVRIGDVRLHQADDVQPQR